MPHIIESCAPDCPKRVVGCHATCKEYKKARAKYEADEQLIKPNVSDIYFMSRRRDQRDAHAKYDRKARPYKGSANNFAK